MTYASSSLLVYNKLFLHGGRTHLPLFMAYSGLKARSRCAVTAIFSLKNLTSWLASQRVQMLDTETIKRRDILTSGNMLTMWRVSWR